MLFTPTSPDGLPLLLRLYSNLTSSLSLFNAATCPTPTPVLCPPLPSSASYGSHSTHYPPTFYIIYGAVFIFLSVFSTDNAFASSIKAGGLGSNMFPRVGNCPCAQQQRMNEWAMWLRMHAQSVPASELNLGRFPHWCAFHSGTLKIEVREVS